MENKNDYKKRSNNDFNLKWKNTSNNNFSLDLWALLLLLVLLWLYLKKCNCFFCSLLCSLYKFSVFCLFRRREYLEKKRGKTGLSYKFIDMIIFSSYISLLCSLWLFSSHRKSSMQTNLHWLTFAFNIVYY